MEALALNLLLFTALLCVTVSTVSASYDTFWGEKDYYCYSEKYSLRTDTCSTGDYDDWGTEDYGCCVHTNEFGEWIALTCPLSDYGTTCPSDSTFVEPVNSNIWDYNGGTWNSRIETTTTNWTFSTISKSESHTDAGNMIALIIGCSVAGLMVLVGLVICCCKCSACVASNQEESSSPYLPRRRIILRCKSNRSTRSNDPFGLLGFTRGRPSNGLPSYDQLAEETEKNEASAVPPSYYEVVNDTSSAMP